MLYFIFRRIRVDHVRLCSQNFVAMFCTISLTWREALGPVAELEARRLLKDELLQRLLGEVVQLHVELERRLGDGLWQNASGQDRERGVAGALRSVAEAARTSSVGS